MLSWCIRYVIHALKILFFFFFVSFFTLFYIHLCVLSLHPGTVYERPCPRGFVCPDTVTIKECSLGEWCPERSREASPCPVGSYCKNPKVRVPCFAGVTCPEGSTMFHSCTERPGFYCDGGADYLPCEAGYYCPSVSEKERCPPGHQCPILSAAPQPCKPGTVAATAGEAACSDCSTGHYAPNRTMTACLTCPAGTFADHRGAEACTSCPSGYTSSEGASFSSQCVPIPGTDTVQVILRQILISIPAVAGAIFLFFVGIWLRRRQNDRSWARFAGYNVANSVRKALRLSIGSVTDAKEQGYLLRFEYLFLRVYRGMKGLPPPPPFSIMGSSIGHGLSSSSSASSSSVLRSLSYHGRTSTSFTAPAATWSSSSSSSLPTPLLETRDNSINGSEAGKARGPGGSGHRRSVDNSSSEGLTKHQLREPLLGVSEDDYNDGVDVDVAGTINNSRSNNSSSTSPAASDVGKTSSHLSSISSTLSINASQPLSAVLSTSAGTATGGGGAAAVAAAGDDGGFIARSPSHDMDLSGHDLPILPDTEAFLIAESLSPNEQERFAAAINRAVRNHVHFPKLCGEASVVGKITFPRAYVLGVLPHPFPCWTIYDFSEKHFALKIPAIAADAIALLRLEDNDYTSTSTSSSISSSTPSSSSSSSSSVNTGQERACIESEGKKTSWTRGEAKRFSREAGLTTSLSSSSSSSRLRENQGMDQV